MRLKKTLGVLALALVGGVSTIVPPTHAADPSRPAASRPAPAFSQSRIATVDDEVLAAYHTRYRQDAWAYYRFIDPSGNFDPSYVPRPVDYRGQTVFMGYVVTPEDGAWGGASFTCCASTYYIFRTTLRAKRDLVIPIVLTGDDGHSLLVNGNFVGGGGFGEVVRHNLVLPANRRVSIEVAGFNASGPYVFELRHADTGQGLAQVEGVRLRAPKPSAYY